MGIEYELALGRKQDFDVIYKILSAKESRSPSVLMQGSRPNWVFATDVKNQLVPTGVQFGVVPEFVGPHSERWPDNSPPRLTGTARVWIRFEAMRMKHGPRFQLGVKGYLTDGAHLLAECTVSKIVAISDIT